MTQTVLTALQEALTQTKARLENYRKAEEYILMGGASYTLSDNGIQRSVTQANLKWVQQGIVSLENKVKSLEAEISGLNVHRGVYRGV